LNQKYHIQIGKIPAKEKSKKLKKKKGGIGSFMRERENK
jgi:hypothetical protein